MLESGGGLLRELDANESPLDRHYRKWQFIKWLILKE
jgi:hypothetical protein